MSDPAKSLAISSDGAIMRQLPGHVVRDATLAVFEMNGGVTWYAGWAKENPTDFFRGPFTKLMPKQIEVDDKRGVEDLLDELDGGVIEAEFFMVDDDMERV
jgi:hypothetical protein